MTQQQFIEEAKRLSVAERVALIEAISRSLREDLELHQESVSSVPLESKEAKTQDAEREKIPISQRLYGILKFAGDPPTDEEVKDAYTDYLLEKYS